MTSATPARPLTREVERAYAQLEERILARDQVGASDVLYTLVRQERPLTEVLHEAVRISAPYIHAPYHQRLDDGVVRFVNNDHALLSARASLRLPGYMPDRLRFLPVAQTIWYMPTALDAWNQLLGNAPGHYNRRGQGIEAGDHMAPAIYWEEQEPLYLDGAIDERLNHWLTLVMRSQVIEAYRVLLGLLEDEAHRSQVLAHLAFAGLINVQDRVFRVTSYTTGHRSYRMRATIELAEAVGWEHAQGIVHAGVPDIAVGPHWYSLYEMACQIAMRDLAEEPPRSSLAPTPPQPSEARLLHNAEAMTDEEVDRLAEIVLTQHEPGYQDEITRLLLAGKAGRSVVDALQVAAARALVQVEDHRGYTIIQHVCEYMNTLAWFFDRFEHKHRLKLLYVAAGFLNQHAMAERSAGRLVSAAPPAVAAPGDAHALSRDALLRRLDDAIMAVEIEQSIAWTQAYLDSGDDRDPLVRTIALAASKMGNDPHNQEVGLSLLEDYLTNATGGREALLLAASAHTAGHMKYGDATEPYRRFAEAMSVTSNGRDTEGIAEPEEQLLDD